MGKKYIIEIPEDKITDFVGSTHFLMPYIMAGHIGHHDTGLPIEPYTAPDLERVREEAYQKGYETGYEDGYNEPGKNQQEVYQRGLNDAWEAARKIANMPYGDEEKAFGSGGWAFVEKHTASEAIEKIRQYEQELENEFKVGDEFKNEKSGKKFVVLKMNGKEIDRYIDVDGKTYCMTVKYKEMRKTGRHFSEVAALFEQMREGGNQNHIQETMSDDY